jgi:hypothetical protein
LDYHGITIGLPLDYHRIAIGLPSDYNWISIGLPLDCHWIAIGLPLDYHWISIGLALDYQSIVFVKVCLAITGFPFFGISPLWAVREVVHFCFLTLRHSSARLVKNTKSSFSKNLAVVEK